MSVPFRGGLFPGAGSGHPFRVFRVFRGLVLGGGVGVSGILRRLPPRQNLTNRLGRTLLGLANLLSSSLSRLARRLGSRLRCLTNRTSSGLGHFIGCLGSSLCCFVRCLSSRLRRLTNRTGRGLSHFIGCLGSSLCCFASRLGGRLCRVSCRLGDGPCRTLRGLFRSYTDALDSRLCLFHTTFSVPAPRPVRRT